MATDYDKMMSDSVEHALTWVVQCPSAAGGDHLEALDLLDRMGVFGSTPLSRERQTINYLEYGHHQGLNRDQRSKCADVVRVARRVVDQLYPLKFEEEP